MDDADTTTEHTPAEPTAAAVARLAEEVAALRAEVDALKRQLAARPFAGKGWW